MEFFTGGWMVDGDLNGREKFQENPALVFRVNKSIK
jgi:hypothetical protein